MAVLMVSCNSACMDFWGRRNATTCLAALHFCLSLGVLTGTGMVDPLVSEFSTKKRVVQNFVSMVRYRSKCKYFVFKAQTHLPGIVKNALKISPTVVPPIQLQVNSTSQLRLKRSPGEIKDDPVLNRVFGKPVTSTAPIHLPRKKLKPAFTDAKKLDHSRNWDLVKVCLAS